MATIVIESRANSAHFSVSRISLRGCFWSSNFLGEILACVELINAVWAADHAVDGSGFPGRLWKHSFYCFWTVF